MASVFVNFLDNFYLQFIFAFFEDRNRDLDFEQVVLELKVYEDFITALEVFCFWLLLENLHSEERYEIAFEILLFNWDLFL